MLYGGRQVSKGGDVCAIFVHAGAGFHSQQNEIVHLEACNDAAKSAMLLLRNGASAVDAVEMAVKILEDREITNAGYGSNLAMDGVVECDASIVDHHGRSGAVGAVAQIKNPISLARCVLDHTMKPLTLRRVPPNLLVSQGATDFAFEQGIPVLPHDALVSPAARERWQRWKSDLKYAERKARKEKGEPAPAYRLDEKAKDPHFENEKDRVRRKIREEHTKSLVNNMVHQGRCRSPQPPDTTPKREHSSPSTSTTSSSWATEDMSEAPSSPESVSDRLLTSGAPVRLLHESSSNAFINSTQTVPTLTNLSNSSLVKQSDEDTLMGDADDALANDVAPLLQRHWADGSSGDSDSTSSSDTLQLPSLTPSPPPTAASKTPLPDIRPGETESPSPLAFKPLPLKHVNDPPPLPPFAGAAPEQHPQQEDSITDTVGAIAIDSYGNIACGASSGGIGMKYRGRVGPAALVGVGAAVVPMDPEDKDNTSVATVTSGTGEHMATTMAATVCAERLYHGVRKMRGGMYESVNDDDAVRSMIETEFMGHPSVKSSNSAGAIGILGVKKTRDGVFLYFAHNTDSFALASMHSDEARPVCTMSRSSGNGSLANGGRALRYRKKKPTQRSNDLA